MNGAERENAGRNKVSPRENGVAEFPESGVKGEDGFSFL
jgi:hypothetical protein